MLTKNENQTINLLLRNFHENFTIREIGRRTNTTPMGARKILKKLKRNGILTSKKIGTGIFYKMNLENKTALKISELVLTQYKINPFAQVYAEYLNVLREHTQGCILFGSILKKGEEAKDVDIMLLLEKRQFKRIEKLCSELSKSKAKEMHFIMQTKEDFIKNLKEENSAVLDILRKGAVLWGENYIVEAIRYVTEKEI